MTAKLTTIWFMNKAMCVQLIASEGCNVTWGRSNCSVWWGAKRLKLTLTVNILIPLSLPAFPPSKEEHGQIPPYQKHISSRLRVRFDANSTSSHEYWLRTRTIADKNVAACFHDLNLILMQNYCITSKHQFHFKSLHFQVLIKQYLKLNKDWFTRPSSFVK